MISRSVRLRGQLLHRRLGTWNCVRRSAIGIGFETETLRLRQILFPLCASFVSLVRMLILNCEFCFDSHAASASLLFWNFAHLPLRQVQVHRIRRRGQQVPSVRTFCMDRLFPSVGPEVFMSFVTNRQGSQITDFGKLLQGGWLMRNEKPSEKKWQENIIYKTFSCLPDKRERKRPEQVSRFGKFAWPEVVALFLHLPWVKGDADDLFEIVPNNRNYNWMSTSKE